MDMPDHQPHPADLNGPETPEQAAARIAWEREVIARAQADIAAGSGVEWSAVKAWLLQLDDDPDAPPPQPQHPVAGQT